MTDLASIDRGRIIAKDDGQVRERWIYDSEGGRHRQPGDDPRPTGTNDDFCAAVLDHWGL